MAGDAHKCVFANGQRAAASRAFGTIDPAIRVRQLRNVMTGDVPSASAPPTTWRLALARSTSVRSSLVDLVFAEAVSGEAAARSPDASTVTERRNSAPAAAGETAKRPTTGHVTAIVRGDGTAATAIAQSHGNRHATTWRRRAQG